MERSWNTKFIVEAAIMIALAQVLSYIKIYHAPQGGAVTAGSMIPIIVLALRWGWKKGVIAGAVYGVLQLILGGYIPPYPLSIFLDYILAFGVLGLAGLFAGKDLAGAFKGTSLAIFARFVSHYLSGVLIWASYAPKGTSPFIYSLVYNGAYMLPELVISLIIIAIVYKPIIKATSKQ